MSITIGFGSRSTHTERSRASVNVCALMSELAVPHLVLLDVLFVEIEFARQGPDAWAMRGAAQSINLSLDDFSSFSYQRGRKFSAQQRRAFAKLAQQVVHVLDAHFRFTSRSDWKKAARAERRTPNARMHELCSGQREHDCCDETPSRHGRRSIREVLAGLVDPAFAPAGRLFVDLFLAREYLRRSPGLQAEVEPLMQVAFPNTYPLALKFDSWVEREAALYASRCHPEATEPTLAMQLTLRDLQILWRPLDGSVDVQEGAKPRRPPPGAHRS